MAEYGEKPFIDEEVKQRLLTEYELDHEDLVSSGRLLGNNQCVAHGKEQTWQRVLRILGLEEEALAMRINVEITPERRERINSGIEKRKIEDPPYIQPGEGPATEF